MLGVCPTIHVLVTMLLLSCRGSIGSVLSMYVRMRLRRRSDDPEHHDQQHEQTVPSRATHAHSLTGTRLLGNVDVVEFHVTQA